ncbi:hypothetical protein Clacol_007749 [Clathrus columnatus]|uniref:t-SNARE coiled-coil homology domain-containing protein n=1 Tax=Clathrus columnatus TaxID=1419009 RepID=A0AAV5ANK2_9AGAM|nr:hypothetical protein Clacol_007749 [Clathrus columnatus]
MAVQNRTNEFRACVDSIRNRTTRDLTKQHHPTPKTEFSRMAATIGKDLSKTTANLGRLAQLAKRKTLFDDRPTEINELTHWIKQDIAKINKDIASLQAYVRAQTQLGGKTTQIEEHNKNVVTLLQNKLANTSISFKDVLELRTQNMKESRDRTEQFMYSASQAATQAAPTNSLLYASQRPDSQNAKGKGRAVQDGDILALDIGHAEEGIGGTRSDGYMQMELMEQQDSYIQSRSTAIESIESTIAELGQIFTQLATMVAEQRETVQRIDADTADIAHNISGAQRELLKYYAIPLTEGVGLSLEEIMWGTFEVDD